MVAGSGTTPPGGGVPGSPGPITLGKIGVARGAGLQVSEVVEAQVPNVLPQAPAAPVGTAARGAAPSASAPRAGKKQRGMVDLEKGTSGWPQESRPLPGGATGATSLNPASALHRRDSLDLRPPPGRVARSL